jgi:hypothetical protein
MAVLTVIAFCCLCAVWTESAGVYVTGVAGKKIVPSRTLAMKAMLPCLRKSFDIECETKREAAPRGKKWRQCVRRGEGCESLDLDGLFDACNSRRILSLPGLKKFLDMDRESS